ncbi:hypothetical protein D9M70_456080 [compost metagenome]
MRSAMKPAGTKSEAQSLVLIMLIPLWKPATQHRYNCIKNESEPNLHAETQQGGPGDGACAGFCEDRPAYREAHGL